MTTDLFGKELHTEREVQGEQYSGIFVRETPGDRGAILFNDGEKDVWLPKSQITIVDDRKTFLPPGKRPVRALTVVVPDWLAEKSGLAD